MTKTAAIAAQLVDIRNVGTHKVVKLTLHAPEEQAMAIMKAFGWPTMVAPVPVALARLVEQPPQREESASAGADKTKRAFHELPYAQQAALRCNDAIYRAFLREMCGKSARDGEEAAEDIRDLCGVESRRDIRVETDAEKSWLELEQMFSAWQTKERAMA